MQLVVTALMLALLASLLRSWWATRTERDPAGSVASFRRTLAALRPAEPAHAQRRAAGSGHALPGPSRSARTARRKAEAL